MDSLPLKGLFRIESVVIREFFLNTGRVLSILAQVLFAEDLNTPSLPFVLIIAALTQLGIALLCGIRRRDAR